MSFSHLRVGALLPGLIAIGSAAALARPLFVVPAAGVAVAHNLIADGSFESPMSPSGGFTVYSLGQKFGPWTVVGAAGNVGTVSGTFTQNGYAFPAGKGKQWLDLTGLSNSATGVQQTVKTVPGTPYRLSFKIGNVYNPGGIFGTTSTVNVFIDGAMTFSATNTAGMGTMKQVWRAFSTVFQATSAQTVIAFVNGDPSNDTNDGLDAVNLIPSGTPDVNGDE